MVLLCIYIYVAAMYFIFSSFHFLLLTMKKQPFLFCVFVFLGRQESQGHLTEFMNHLLIITIVAVVVVVLVLFQQVQNCSSTTTTTEISTSRFFQKLHSRLQTIHQNINIDFHSRGRCCCSHLIQDVSKGIGNHIHVHDTKLFLFLFFASGGGGGGGFVFESLLLFLFLFFFFQTSNVVLPGLCESITSLDKLVPHVLWITPWIFLVGTAILIVYYFIRILLAIHLNKLHRILRCLLQTCPCCCSCCVCCVCCC
mmetsp:Transcript_27019/g.47711  ORF Transcript_27019/g.47711 Transcript_27019/m.47711 type:complete len:254 (-) Transcript_27019:39-800(-)